MSYIGCTGCFGGDVSNHYSVCVRVAKDWQHKAYNAYGAKAPAIFQTSCFPTPLVGWIWVQKVPNDYHDACLDTKDFWPYMVVDMI